MPFESQATQPLQSGLKGGKEEGRDRSRGADERQKEQQIERERESERGGGRVGWEERRPRSNPSGMCSADSACQRSLTKADPIFVQCLKVPSEKMSFRVGVKKKKIKKNASRLFEIFNQSQGPREKQGC